MAIPSMLFTWTSKKHLTQCLINDYYKVSSFGIHGKILTWIKDFLSNREQQVVLNGHISHSIPVTSGVPQGSALGPVLFTKFVNDIPTIVSSPVYLFADDT